MHLLHHLREFVADYGYWAVAIALLCEHAGLPVPAETALLFASFLAYSEHRLHLGWIIVVATCAGTLGGASDMHLAITEAARSLIAITLSFMCRLRARPR